MKWKALFVGDIVIDQLPGKTFLSHAWETIMADHQVRSCNFEAPISGIGQAIKKAGPHVSQHPQAPSYIEQAGFNLINLANNHIYDFGEEALLRTINSFKQAVCVGAGKNFEEAYQLKTIPVNDIKVGFLSFCEAEFGALLPASKNRAGYAWVNHTLVNSMLIYAKTIVDVLIVQVHAGVEQIDMPLPEWRERYKELIRMGADAIIGSHPHVPQGWETFQGKPIFYSLGNFYFGLPNNHPLWNKGIAVSLHFEGKQFTGYQVIAVEKNAQVVTINEDPAFQQHLKQVNQLLEEPLYTEKINALVQQLWEQYYRNYYNIALWGINENVSLTKVVKTVIKRIVSGKSTVINPSLLLHNIRIESHRWVVERVLELKNNA